MHSCIAAISQNIPAVALAYSDKFQGVFDSAGLKDCVIDLRKSDRKEILKKIKYAFDHRQKIQQQLTENVQLTKQQIDKTFQNICAELKNVPKIDQRSGCGKMAPL